MSTRPTERHLYLEAALLCLILVLAACLRLANLPTNPGWYTDEGTHLDIAQHLAQGRVRYMAVARSTLLFAKLPLFDLILAGLLRLFGGGMTTLRALTAALGLLTVILSYAILRPADRALALLAALSMATYPGAVLYSRFGFSYNLLAPLVLLALLGLWQYADTVRRRWLALSVLAVGLGTISDLVFFSLIPPLVLIVLARRWRDLLWSLPLLALPFGLYVGWMLLASPGAFAFDLAFTLARLGGRSLPSQLENVALNLRIVFTGDVWFPLALAGFIILKPPRLSRLSLLLLVFPFLMMARTVALFSLTRYYLIPLFPLVALGVASLIRWGIPGLFALIAGDSGGSRWWAATGVTGLAVALVIVLFARSTWGLVRQVQTGFTTPIDPFLLDAGDARRATDYVNAHTQPDDLVIASPGLSWRLDARTADFQMSAAASGQATPHLPADLPPDRWVFDPDYVEARYVIVDNLWYNWAAGSVPGVSGMLADVENWEPVFVAGQIVVYRNPAQQERLSQREGKLP